MDLNYITSGITVLMFLAPFHLNVCVLVAHQVVCVYFKTTDLAPVAETLQINKYTEKTFFFFKNKCDQF